MCIEFFVEFHFFTVEISCSDVNSKIAGWYIGPNTLICSIIISKIFFCANPIDDRWLNRATFLSQRFDKGRQTKLTEKRNSFGLK